MTLTSTPVSRFLILAACTGALALTGCDKIKGVPNPSTPPAPPAPSAASPAAQAEPWQPAVALAAPAPAYASPSPEQLEQLVAPIALYPDKLVAQVLAGAARPDQVTAADQWLAQNASLKAGPLADAVERQPWDPGIKSLTAFRTVLDQMADNLPWTTALGQAYYNDPEGTLNAIQAMRQRAQRAGKLKNTPKLRVAAAPAAGGYITIAPAQPDMVYVPNYDPQVIYGEPVPAYPGYAWTPPVYAEPGYSNAQIATAGLLTFGAGVVVGSALQRHDWGWNNWGMNWGRPAPYPHGGRAPGQQTQAMQAQAQEQRQRAQQQAQSQQAMLQQQQQQQQQLQQAQQAQLRQQREQARSLKEQQEQQARQAQNDARQYQIRQQQAQQEDAHRRQGEERSRQQAQTQQSRAQQAQAQAHQQQVQQQQQEQLRRQQAQQQDQARHQQQLQQQQARLAQQQQMQQQQAQRQQQMAQQQAREQAQHQHQQAQQQAQQVAQAQARQMQQQQQQAQQAQQQRRQQEQQARAATGHPPGRRPDEPTNR